MVVMVQIENNISKNRVKYDILLRENLGQNDITLGLKI